MDSLAFLEQLRQSQILSEAQLVDVRQRFLGRFAPHDMAGALQAEGLLTTYQAKQIIDGKGSHLALGQYRILDELGRGGFGQVYRGIHTLMNRVVAIKVIAPERVEDCRAREWFKREIRAVTELNHQ
jgi:serine/threonine-protein kinase